VDIEGNIYKTTQIGTQIWMAQNLKVSKYRDGTDIQKMTGDFTDGDTIGRYYSYKGHSNYVSVFGCLYNYYSVVNRSNVCPSGWHIPSDADWTILENYLGGLSVAGGKLKEAGTSHWLSPNLAATNENGFTALPGSYTWSILTPTFSLISECGSWWGLLDNGFRARSIRFDGSNLDNSFESPLNELTSGVIGSRYFSVRCIKN
jgi:uncharacterized protein (TIGR02145 family)